MIWITLPSKKVPRCPVCAAEVEASHRAEVISVSQGDAETRFRPCERLPQGPFEDDGGRPALGRSVAQPDGLCSTASCSHLIGSGRVDISPLEDLGTSLGIE